MNKEKEQAKSNDEEQNPESIQLPAVVEVFANLKNAQKFAIDIGKFYFALN